MISSLLNHFHKTRLRPLRVWGDRPVARWIELKHLGDTNSDDQDEDGTICSYTSNLKHSKYFLDPDETIQGCCVQNAIFPFPLFLLSSSGPCSAPVASPFVAPIPDSKIQYCATLLELMMMKHPSKSKSPWKWFETDAGEHEALEVKRIDLLCVCAIQVQTYTSYLSPFLHILQIVGQKVHKFAIKVVLRRVFCIWRVRHL